MKDNLVKDANIIYMKAMAIILVVIGHTVIPFSIVNEYIYSFHVPLFFWVSGFCFKEVYLNNLFLFIKKRIVRLYLPYVIWGLVFLALHNVFVMFHIYEQYYGADLLFKLFMKTITFNHTEFLLGGFWFLRVLFISSILSVFLLKGCKTFFARYHIYSIVLAVIILVVYNNMVVIYPFDRFGREFAASILFLTGHFFRKMRVSNLNIWVSFGILFLPFIGIRYWHMHMDIIPYSNDKIIPYLFIAVGVIWALYSIFCEFAVYLNKYVSGLLDYIGGNTLLILTWHLVIFKLVSYLIIIIYQLPIERLSEYPTIADYSMRGWWVIYVVASVGICCGLSLFLTVLKGIRVRN